MHRFSLFVLVVLSTTLVSAQHKTPWGDPDIQGIWSNQSPMPLERPDALAGKNPHRGGGGGIRADALNRLLKTFARRYRSAVS